MRHLEDLLAAHEEILEESPGLWAQLNEFFEEAHTDDEDYGVQ
jgi:hypothetical protein